MIRGTSLSYFPELVVELGGNPDALLRRAGVSREHVGRRDAFITYRGLIRSVESAALATSCPDFGRRLGRRQGIEILGPVGVAASTASTVADAFVIFATYMGAYSPAITTRILPVPQRHRARFQFAVTLEDAPPCPQVIEMSLAVALSVFRLLIAPTYAPLRVHLPHTALTSRHEYVLHYSCAPAFNQTFAGFTIRSADLERPLSQDRITHEAVVDYLRSLSRPGFTGMAQPVRELVRQLLPTGAATLDLVAAQFGLHPKTLQRRLAKEDCTFAGLVDQTRREMAERHLRDTEIDLGHLSRELGYAEQSVFTRSCQRWFGCTPTAHRARLQAQLAQSTRVD